MKLFFRIMCAMAALLVTLVHGELQPAAFAPLPTGTIRPDGWLRRQLVVEAEGLAGHLQRFWVDVMNSSWVGGSGDGVIFLHERFPYWLNGIVPLLFMVPDAPAVARVRSDVDAMLEYVLDHQMSDGALGPNTLVLLLGDWYWSKYDFLLAAQAYAEGISSANSNYTGRLNVTRIVTAMAKYYALVDEVMDLIPLSEWSSARWQDFVLGLQWMAESPLAAAVVDQKVVARLMNTSKAQGFDWGKQWFNNPNFPQGVVPNNEATLWTHGVNNGQAIKAGAVWYRVSGDPSDLQTSFNAAAVLSKYHGQATGMFSCDEHLAGLMPSHGTELCTVVETLFSYETVHSISGNLTFADMTERVAYNALPGEMTNDMWAHQYLEEVNQFHAEPISGPLLWQTDGPNSIMYGLEPNYGCCTANHDQGWPKVSARLLQRDVITGGLVLSLYAPFTASTSLAVVTVATDYPFDDLVNVTLHCSANFPFKFRIPSFADGATVLSGNSSRDETPGSWATRMCVSDTTLNLLITFHFSVRVEFRYNGAASIYRGPLLFAIHPDEARSVLNHYAFDSNDFVTRNASQWAFAVGLNSTNVSSSFSFHRRAGGPSLVPYNTTDPPVYLSASVGPVAWDVVYSVAGAPPFSPTPQPAIIKEVKLLPFGATNLRIAEIPWFNL